MLSILTFFPPWIILGLLCAKKSGRNKNKNKRGLPYAPDDEVDAEEIIAYEEVALYYPRADRKRPVVLIGPPNIGRHELRQRLMQDTDRFAAAIPRKFLAFYPFHSVENFRLFLSLRFYVISLLENLEVLKVYFLQWKGL